MTFSVVARDPVTGQLGVGVASGVLAVGRAAPWAQAGVGAVATQSRTRRSYGPRALDGLLTGDGPEMVLARLLSEDPDSATRQVGMVAADGEAAAHTGSECMPVAGHRSGNGWAVLGNTLASEDVLTTMADAISSYGRHHRGGLAERLLQTLAAGEAAGGDLRGTQSAALLVVGPDLVAEPWDFVPVDLRVDAAPEPLPAMERLLDLQRAYENDDSEVVSALANPGPGDLHAVLAATRRGDLNGAREALVELTRRPGWDGWLRAQAADGRLPHLAGLLESGRREN
jgi:uncharacterized Ntn-hydrolase superfamily protein